MLGTQCLVRQWMVSVVSGCCLWSKLDFRGDAPGAILGSTVDTCSASASRGSLTNFTYFPRCGGLVFCSIVSVRTTLRRRWELCRTTLHGARKTARASGKHPGVLMEPEVQLEAATVGYVAASAPLQAVASLAGGDEVDATTTKYLLKCALRKRQKEEEEKRRRKEKKEDEEPMKRAQRIIDGAFFLASSSGKRRKKRRRKRKGADSFLPVVDVPVIMPQIQFIYRRLVFQLWRRDKYPQCMLHSSRCSSWTRFLACPVCCFDKCLVRWCRKLWSSRSCSPSLAVDIPLRSAEADHHGPDRPSDHRHFPVAEHGWPMSLLCDFTCFRRQRNAWTSVLHAMRQPTVLWLFSTVPCI